ncbi:MAG: Chaperone protein dnaK2 [candidate division BRC1 bacterium ADurb.BinA364]|nr:MAG: Chaperone protein dnaK2 [candidate division BRC1 bacterium ADurb.BinA364]
MQELVKRLTGGKQPNMSVNPDEVVAVGAAVQAGIIKGEVRDVLLLDVTPLSLGLETMGGVMTKLIDRNTTIPCRRSEIFSTAEDNQPAVDIVVLQGERDMARDNRQLGRFQLSGIRPAPRGTPQIEVTFDIDANGILHVSAQDKATGKEQKITISGSTNLDKGEIDRMVKEAEAHSAEDKKRRELVEERNMADQLAYQTEKMMAELGDKVPAHEKARIEQLIGDIRSSIKNDAIGIERIRQLKGDLQQAAHGLSASMSQSAQPHTETGSSQQASGQAGARPAGEDDVIDAEFTQN